MDNNEEQKFLGGEADMDQKQEEKMFQEYFRKIITTPVKQETFWKPHELDYYKEVIRRPTKRKRRSEFIKSQG